MKFESDSFKVDFIGVGATKSGTTWLSDCLGELPEIFHPDIKELYYFYLPENEKGIKSLEKLLRKDLSNWNSFDRI